MAATEIPDPDFTELGFRVSKLRVSLRIRRGEVRQVSVPQPEMVGRGMGSEAREAVGIESTSESRQLDGGEPVRPSKEVEVGRQPLNPDCPDSVEQSGHFRSRLSSTSSGTSVDSGISSPLARSRTNSSASTSSRSGNILRRIARAAVPVGAENAIQEFECFNYLSVTSSSRSPVSLTPSSSSSARLFFPATNPRLRGDSSSRDQARVSSSRDRARVSSSRDRARVSSDSSDYSDLYSTIEELSDPLEEEDTAPPPLPPRKARLRTPALPPYPSTAIRVVDSIISTMLF